MDHDSSLSLLRHSVSTLAYRGGKTLCDAPDHFASFRAAESIRTPSEIRAHIGDLFDRAIAMVDNRIEWRHSEPLRWPQEVARCFNVPGAFDARLAAGTPPGIIPEMLFQGPFADAFTHLGQLAMLRRMAGAPLRSENYLVAEIVAGRVGATQAEPNRGFD
jgi:hypothetical protein